MCSISTITITLYKELTNPLSKLRGFIENYYSKSQSIGRLRLFRPLYIYTTLSNLIWILTLRKFRGCSSKQGQYSRARFIILLCPKISIWDAFIMRGRGANLPPSPRKYRNMHKCKNATNALQCTKEYCHSLVLILFLIPIKTRSDNIFGPKPSSHHPSPPTTIHNVRLGIKTKVA